LTQENHTTIKELVNSLLKVLHKCDPKLQEHAERVANNCVLFSKEIDLSEKEPNQLYIAALLHDIGMVYIPKEIASKKQGLSNPEMAFIKKHTIISEKILSKHAILKDLLPIIRFHHEAVDGSGYPDGLKGDAIPIGAKILSIANSFDSFMTHGLNGRETSLDGALTEIEKRAGHQFDEALANGFIKFIKSSSMESPDNGTVKDPSEDKTGLKAEIETNIETDSISKIIDQIIKKFKKGDTDLPVLPEIIREVQMIINSNSSGMNELSAVIEKDAVISVKLISVANSVMYRGAEKILSVKQAIPRIGAKEIHSIVATIANKSLYEAKDPFFKDLMQKIWTHSLATALFSKALAEKLRLGDAERYYFMGLIHDIGQVLLLKVFDDLHHKNKNIDINEVLDRVKEVHTSFGSSILRKWGFSEKYIRVCLLHEGPKFKEGMDKAILVVNLAVNLANKAGFGVTDDSNQVDLSRLDSTLQLEIDQDTLDPILESIKTSIEEASDIFS